MFEGLDWWQVASFTDAWIETLPFDGIVTGRQESHLLQMRGLKLIDFHKRTIRYMVASFTDAWIETSLCGRQRRLSPVASFTDAWIETFDPLIT